MVSEIVARDSKEIISELKDKIQKFRGKTFLITGGAGFLGSYLANVLHHMNENYLDSSCKFIVVDNFVTGVKDNIKHLMNNKSFSFINHDITNPLDIKDDVNYIIHLASIASPVAYRKFPLETIFVNVWGTRNVLDLAKGKKVDSFLFLSSSEVYGDPTPENIPTPESYRGNVSFTGPRACYDESKRLGETLCVNYFKQFDTPVKIGRPFNVFGPGLKPNDGRVIADLVNDALTKKKIILYSDGSPKRSFCYVSDIIRGFIYLLLSRDNGEAFNVGNKEEISMLKLAEIVKELVGGYLKIVFEKHEDIDYTVDSPKRRCPNLSKIQELGYSPKVPLKEGLKRYIEWYKDMFKVK